jgi:hypothetical protein
MTDKFQNLPENESIEQRVERVAKEREAFNEQMAAKATAALKDNAHGK